MLGKENEGTSVSASLIGSIGSSYVARLQRRQELEKLRDSVAGKSVSERLMRKSVSLRPPKGDPAVAKPASPLLPTVPQSPISSVSPIAPGLDDAAEKLQRELETYDKALMQMRTSSGTVPSMPLPTGSMSGIRSPTPQPNPAPPPTDESIVRNVITATGQGCKYILGLNNPKVESSEPVRKGGLVWKTRAHKTSSTESSCMLQLKAKQYHDVGIRITFTDAATVPALLCFEHAPTPTAAFVMLGEVPLEEKSMKQLKHVFRLGTDTVVERILRITCLGRLSPQHGGVHCVSQLRITGVPVGPEGVVAQAAETQRAAAAVAGRQEEQIPVAENRGNDRLADVEVNVSLDASEGSDGDAAGRRLFHEDAFVEEESAEAKDPVLVTPQRADTVHAVLSQLKMTPEEAKHALLRMLGDEENTTGAARDLSPVELESILACLPTDEERPLLMRFQGSWVNVTPCERFMLSVLRIPALKPRLQAAIFLNSFDSRAAATAEAAISVITACTEIRDSALLQSALKTALAIANFLNVGNLNGAAVAGFQVEGLLKLRDIKSKRSRTPTLLHFLARDLERHHPEGSSLSAELRSCKEAARISLGDLRSELDALAEGVEAAHDAGTAAGADSEHLEEFLDAATDRLVAVNAAVVEADAAFMELRSVVNGEPSTMDEPAAFFTLMSTFCRDLDTAHAENAAADEEAGKRRSSGGGRRPASAPAQRGSHSPGGSSDAARHSSEYREEGAEEGTPPKERRDRVLETIRAYSRLTASQRKRLLTDKEAKTRFEELSKMDSFFPTEALNRASTGGAGAGPALKPAVRAASDQTARSLRSSGPASSLASLLAPRSAGCSERTNNNAAAAPGQGRTSMGGSSCSPSEGASTCHSGAVSLQLEDEVASQSNSKGRGDTLPTAAAISSPVARMLASSRQLVESIANRPDELEEDEYSDYSDDDDLESDYSSDDYSSDYSDARHSDVSVRSMGPGAEGSPNNNNGGAMPGSKNHHQSYDEQDKAASPVTFRPLSASGNGVTHPEATPQVAWGRKSVGGASGRGLVVARPSSPEERTPEGAFLECTASLQPLPGAAQFGDSLRGFDQRGATTRPAVPASSNASQALSDRNPMGSAAWSLPYGNGGSTGQYNRALEDDAASPEKRREAPRNSNSYSAAAWESQKAAEPHRSSTQWMAPGGNPTSVPGRQVPHQATAAAVVQLRGSNAGGVRNSKRVSFSLPNSPRSNERESPAPSPVIDMQKLAELEAAYDNEAGYFSEDYEEDDFSESEFVESPIGLSPIMEQNAKKEEPRHYRVRGQKPIALHRDYEQQKTAQRGGGSVEDSRQKESLAKVDLSQVKQLVKNAAQVQRSRERQQAAYASGGSAAPSGDFYSTPQNDGTAEWDYDEQYSDDEYNPNPIAKDRDTGDTYSGSQGSLHDEQGTAAMHNSQAFASQMRDSLPSIPGVASDTLPGLPLTKAQQQSPQNFDGFMSAVISNAGNTPTGPLARGVRQGDTHLFDDAAAGVLRAAAARRAAQAAGTRPGQTHKALLEPIVPAPLGMGVRVSETVASGISPNTLKTSLEAHLHQMQQTRSDARYPGGAVRGSVASVAAPAPTPANTAVDASAGSLQYNGQYNGGGSSRGQVGASVPSAPSGPMLTVEKLGLSATRRSKIKSGSARGVNSALAQERMARWDALQR